MSIKYINDSETLIVTWSGYHVKSVILRDAVTGLTQDITEYVLDHSASSNPSKVIECAENMAKEILRLRRGAQ